MLILIRILLYMQKIYRNIILKNHTLTYKIQQFNNHRKIIIVRDWIEEDFKENLTKNPMIKILINNLHET